MGIFLKCHASSCLGRENPLRYRTRPNFFRMSRTRATRKYFVFWLKIFARNSSVNPLLIFMYVLLYLGSNGSGSIRCSWTDLQVDHVWPRSTSRGSSIRRVSKDFRIVILNQNYIHILSLLELEFSVLGFTKRSFLVSCVCVGGKRRTWKNPWFEGETQHTQLKLWRVQSQKKHNVADFGNFCFLLFYPLFSYPKTDKWCSHCSEKNRRKAPTSFIHHYLF